MIDKYRQKHRKNFKIKKKKPFLLNKYLWIIVLFLATAGAFFYAFFISPIFQAKNIIVSGAETIKAGDVQNVIENNLSKKIIFFETKNIFLADLEKISADIISKFPQVSEIELSRNFYGEITAKVVEKSPAGVLCNIADCFYYDKSGIVFEKSSRDFNPKIKINPPEYYITIGKKEVSEQIVKIAAQTQKILSENFAIENSDFILSSDQKIFTAKTSEGWKIFFEPSEDMSSQVQNLDILLKQKISSQDRKKLDYIDLRFGNKIFYKKK